MMSNPIGIQLINLSTQLFNLGIQAFNYGINTYISYKKEKFYQEFRKTSEKIKSIINEYDTKQKEKILIQ